MKHSWQRRKCHDISSIYWVSGLFDTISANDNQLKEKSNNIGDISLIYRTNIGNKCSRGTKNIKFYILADMLPRHRCCHNCEDVTANNAQLSKLLTAKNDAIHYKIKPESGLPTLN